MCNQDNGLVAENTDRELWSDDSQSASIHVTKSGAIGLTVGGYTIVKRIRAWHKLFEEEAKLRKALEETQKHLEVLEMCHSCQNGYYCKGCPTSKYTDKEWDERVPCVGHEDRASVEGENITDTLVQIREALRL